MDDPNVKRRTARSAGVGGGAAGEGRSPITHSGVRALRGVPDFAPLGDAALLKVFGASCNLWWPSGSTVFERGDEGDAFFIVISGEVAVIDPDEPDQARNIGPGGFFGELALYRNEPRAMTVKAVADTELMCVPRSSLDALLASSPDVADSLRQMFAERDAAFRR